MNNKEAALLAARYFFLVLISFQGLTVLYWILTPVTSYLSYISLNLLFGAKILAGGTIFLKGLYIDLIPACIAGSAFYLLLILNLTSPMPGKKRIKSIAFLVLSFLILNVIRIFIFSVLATSGTSYFDYAHKFVWYVGSTVLVVILWFINVYMFNIHAIPIYTDFNNILRSGFSFKPVDKKQILRDKIKKIEHSIESEEKRKYAEMKRDYNR
ncbi:MAG: pacearchaeosortase [archaeon]